MFRLDEESVDVIEPAIGGFCHQRARPTLKNRILIYLPLDDRVAHDTHGMCIRNPDRTFKKAAFLHPGRAGHLAVAIEWEPRCKYGIVIFLPARMNNGHASAGRVTFNDGGISNRDSIHISDGIMFPSRAFEW